MRPLVPVVETRSYGVILSVFCFFCASTRIRDPKVMQASGEEGKPPERLLLFKWDGIGDCIRVSLKGKT